MGKDELIQVLSKGEDGKNQFKLDITDPDSLAAEMVAFSNCSGGKIFIGVDDFGIVQGLAVNDIRRINQLISNTASQLVNPSINVQTENVSHQSGVVLILAISDGISKPYMDNKGVVWVKNGSDKRKSTSREELQRMFQQGGGLLADEIGVYGTSIDDIDEWLFAQYFQKEFKASFQEKGLTYQEALKAKKVLRDGKTTLAGLLFFGKNPQDIKPAFTIKAVSFFGNDISDNQYRNKPEDFKGTIPEIYKQAMNFLTSNLLHLQKEESFNSNGVLEISKIALEEIVQNALVHRDYFKNAPIRLLIFENRVEIISPGCLPNSLTVEEVKYGNTVIRNNQIAVFSANALPYSGLGSGLKRAFKEQSNIELINDVSGGQFIVKIPRYKTDKKL